MRLAPDARDVLRDAKNYAVTKHLLSRLLMLHHDVLLRLVRAGLLLRLSRDEVCLGSSGGCCISPKYFDR